MTNANDWVPELMNWAFSLTLGDPPTATVEAPIPDSDWRCSGSFLLQGTRLVLAEVKVFPGGDRLRAMAGDDDVHTSVGRVADRKDSKSYLWVGAWSRGLNGLSGVKKSGNGITTAHLRGAPVVEMRAFAQRELVRCRDFTPEVEKWFVGRAAQDTFASFLLGFSPQSSVGVTVGETWCVPWQVLLGTGPEHPGRAGRPAGYWALPAARYVELMNAGDRTPLKTMAAEADRTSAQIRDLLSRARVNGFLTSEPRFAKNRKVAEPSVAGGSLTEKAITALQGLREQGRL